MATAARKARKAAGVKFTRRPKVGTPVEERSWFASILPPLTLLGAPRRRSEKARRRALADRGIEWTPEVES